MFKKRDREVGRILLLLGVLIACVSLRSVAEHAGQVSDLSPYDCEGAMFRCQDVGDSFLRQLERIPQSHRIKVLGISMMMADYHRPTSCRKSDRYLLLYRRESYHTLCRAYDAIWADVRCFPLKDPEVSYEDTWMEPRAYQGQRVHEGCDLFSKKATAGCDLVCSMTDGMVEKVGWLPLGGYRIGIRAPHGGYYYYAHLDSYIREFQVGDFVYAGELLGYMGNTGYGIEGTKGKFPVHLHLGIYIQTKHYTELSVNPYWVLRYSQIFN